jgi:hypothetical protein
MGNSSVAVAPSVTVDSAFFSDVATGYNANDKLINALVSSENPDADFKSAMATIANIRAMAQNGKGYTPDKSLGFGSDNAATIAEKILGTAKSATQVRKLLRDAGKRS